MGTRGPAPLEHRTRARDTAVRETIKSDGKLGGFELPEDAIVDRKTGTILPWHPMTVKWWDAWRASPQATRMVTDVDWYYLLDTAFMHHQMWTTGRFELAGEVRQRVANFGATPADRLRLKLEVEVLEEYPVGNRGNDASVTRIDSRRDRWAAGS